MGRRYSVGIVGESNYQQTIGELRQGEHVDLVPEPDNPHDNRAVSVRDGDGSTIGYLPRGHWLTDAILDQRKQCTARVERIEGGDAGRPSLGVVIEVELGGDGVMPTASTPIGASTAKRLAKDPDKASNWKAGCVVLLVLVLLIAYCSGDGDDVAPVGDQREAETNIAVDGSDVSETEAGPVSQLTAPQRNARRNAESYLAMTGFSRQGLIDQLSSDSGNGYAVADATAAVDSLDVNWKAQAARSAQSYLNMTGFSCQGLVEQLSSSSGSQYTLEEARYGAQQAGAC